MAEHQERRRGGLLTTGENAPTQQSGMVRSFTGPATIGDYWQEIPAVLRQLEIAEALHSTAAHQASHCRQNAKMRRSMTMPSRTDGLSSGHAAATATVTGVNRVLTAADFANFTGASGHRAEMELYRHWQDDMVARRRTDFVWEAGGGGAAPTQQPSAEAPIPRGPAPISLRLFDVPDDRVSADAPISRYRDTMARFSARRTQGYAAAAATSSGVIEVLNNLTIAGDGTGTGGHSLGNFTGSLSFRAAIEHLHRLSCDAVVAQRRTDSDLEEGRGGAAPTPRPVEEVDKMMKDFICQFYAALQPASALAPPALKDAPDRVKLITFGGLVVINIALFAGMLSRSPYPRRLAFRLVSCLTVTLLTFGAASQLSVPTHIAITAVVGVLLSLVMILLPFP